MNSVRSNNLSLKYQRFATSGCKDIRIRKFEFVAKTQFLCEPNHRYVCEPNTIKIMNLTTVIVVNQTAIVFVKPTMIYLQTKPPILSWVKLHL